ncbi:hypothetical protein [Halorubrum pallidum]|uniref:Intracellular proteinase inhibitor BsuPI domain-containing protein n=1 Tax=Halorubrum pallidum TaxID=1526114 RepID=A0ABD5T3I4_9EURY
MDRRKFVSGPLVGGAIISAGCTGLLPWNPTIDGEELTLSPGEKSMITIEVTDIGGFSFQPAPEGITIVTTRSEIDVTPPPDSGGDSDPPQWFWSSRTDVTVEAPIAISDSVEPGEYQYGVTVWRKNQHSDEVQARFDLTITSD